VRINDVYANHRWKVQTYKDGVYQWNWLTGWNDVGYWSWSKAYFWPSLSNASSGSWEFQVYVDAGNGFQYIDSSRVVVN
jgi:hypothetical protein